MRNLAAASLVLYALLEPSAHAETGEPSTFHSLGNMIVKVDDLSKVGVSPTQVTVWSSIVRSGEGGSRPGYQNAILGTSKNAADIKFFTDLVSGHWAREIDEPRLRGEKALTFINPRKVSLVSPGRVGRDGTRALFLYDEHGLLLGNTFRDKLGDQLQGLAAELKNIEAAQSPGPR